MTTPEELAEERRACEWMYAVRAYRAICSREQSVAERAAFMLEIFGRRGVRLMQDIKELNRASALRRELMKAAQR